MSANSADIRAQPAIDRTQAAGNPHEEILRSFDGLPGLGMFQNIAVVNSSDAEEFETIGIGIVNGAVQLASIRRYEVGGNL